MSVKASSPSSSSSCAVRVSKSGERRAVERAALGEADDADQRRAAARPARRWCTRWTSSPMVVARLARRSWRRAPPRRPSRLAPADDRRAPRGRGRRARRSSWPPIAGGPVAADHLVVLADDEDAERGRRCRRRGRPPRRPRARRRATPRTVRADGLRRRPWRRPDGRRRRRRVEANSAVKLRLRVSLKTRVPTTNATPSTIAKVLIRSRTLRPSRLLSAARNISPPPGALIRAMTSRTLLAVGVAQLVDDPAVGEEDDAVGVRRRHRVVGDHHDGLAVVGRRCAGAGRAPPRPTASRGCRSARPRRRSAAGSARARATATRCCWPPESSLGRWPSRSRMPTVSMTESYHSRSGLRRRWTAGAGCSPPRSGWAPG